jgi:hypothetical protein
MARTRSVDFLPEIFQTPVNKQFLAATLDQLIQEPKFKKTQGFIGRTVGPGVNPNDAYVVEPGKTRQDYQLEPGVVSLKPDTNVINNVITYPGINDAVALQGGNIDRADLLYNSDYYTWDPFIDYDSFINFSQYYWLPSGPSTVDVNSSGVPLQQNFSVTRGTDSYLFSGQTGANPTLYLVRGGNYNFAVAQNATETVNYRVANDASSSYQIQQQTNPTLTLVRGNTYVFELNLNGDYPFWIKTEPSLGTGDAYQTGVRRNGSAFGDITFVVPQDAPDTLYYTSQNFTNMQGILQIVDGQSGTGPGFWIQTAPGVSGTVPSTPNISSRNVLGVINNGTDLGTIEFEVPSKTAQQFYYNLPNVGPVDFLTDLPFNEINNQPLATFIQTQGGIDGVTYLQNRTLVFTSTEESGWVNGASTVAPADRYQIWQINIVSVLGVDVINLAKIANVGFNQKFTLAYGNQYSNTSWYKNNLGLFQQIPLLSAVTSELYYQDSTNPDLFGRIVLLDSDQQNTIFIDNILGQSAYTSPNGVVFTNGLKVRFTGDVIPASAASNSAQFTCTATTAGSNLITCSSTAGLYEGIEIVFSGTTAGGIVPGDVYYVKSIVANGIQFSISTVVDGATYAVSTATVAGFTAIATSNNEFYVSGVGTAIALLPVRNFVTPETYVVDANDSTIATEPDEVDYLTIDRASNDLNAWTRSNRWFHVDVITAAAGYNNTVIELNNNYRAKRPIISFRPGIRLFNMGVQGKQPVDVIDFETTDAFSEVEGSTGYAIDGYSLVDGSRVIFAADLDPDVRNKIYTVQFIEPDSVPPLITQPIIHLSLTSDGLVVPTQSTVCLEGNDLKGITFWYDGVEWLQAQQKTSVQQAPLFDVYDANGFSFANTNSYPSSTFVGSKLFSYAVGDTSVIDPILKFPLQYLNINNVGDIVFENNLYKDTFVYVVDNVSTTADISSGLAREYVNIIDYTKLIGWQPAAATSQQYQQFRFVYTGRTLTLDVAVSTTTVMPVLKIYVGSNFVSPNDYTYRVSSRSTVITFDQEYLLTDVIEVLALSDQSSTVGFYQVPVNLQNNPLNSNSNSFTLGTIRTQYQTICENLPALTGPIAGANNTRDLGNLVPYGLTILQHSAPMTLAGYFLRSDQYNIWSSMQFNSNEYLKFKGQLLNAVTQQTIQFQGTADVLDTALADITLGRVETQPFYWSDMLPAGAVYTTLNYTVSRTTTNTFDVTQVYNYTSANYLGMNVYLNNVILMRDRDYTVATDGPRITVLINLTLGDQLMIREYADTAGNFVPNTPTKLGLYPAWRPEIVTIQTTSGAQTVIIGHDGSQTRTFDDIRDDVLLEFETRIFNNLKLDGNPVPLTATDVIPGQFRSTGYSLDQINNILGTDFLSYVAWNKLDYKTQDYQANNEFSWNYSDSQSRLDNNSVPGAWRGINRLYYDTQQPQLVPWELLGFTIKPSWWQDRYGPAPYSQDNLVLWEDLEAGYVADPVAPYYLPQYARPGLLSVIPTGTEGQLLSPFDSVISTFDAQTFRKSWSLGDGGPVEASWWNSSAYPFAVMRLLALTQTAKFFALFADRDLYKFNSDYGQYLYDNRYRLNANRIEVYGNGVSKASYINWIVDYNRQSGLDSTNDLSNDLDFIDVRLCYRMASFSDKQYIKIYTEKSSPNSVNTTFLIPDENYNLVLYKNQPFDRASYSAVVIQKSGSGYAVFGYSTSQPYFTVQQSMSSGLLQTYTVAGVTVKVSTVYTDNTVNIPYGYVFASTTAVADFLLSYGQYLQRQGLTFEDSTNGYILNWPQMVTEFLYWSQQGWDESALINLNPLAFKLSVTKPQAVVDSIQAQTTDNILLDQNRRELFTRNLIITRLDNTFTVEPANEQTLSFIDVKYTSYEHMIVLDNSSLFGDVIYDPITGARQSRLNLTAVTTTEWNGSVDAQGFVLNQNNIEEWNPDRTYTKGEIVLFKGAYWSAATIVQPTAVFNANDWIKSDTDQIQLGLLPNLATKADQLTNSYNINSANLESDNDLLSYGLIGFRPREYMTSLNLDDVSQVNVYRQFLDSKGTVLSAELFSQVNLGKEAADYDIFENWAVQRAVYGANANRSYVQLRLDQALLDANPSVIQVINTQQTSEADQTVLVSEIWRESFPITSPDFLPTTTDLPTDTALPSAGYVNLDDVDITVFDINNTDSLSASIDSIGVGTTVWVAKINDYDWAIYRTQAVPGTISHVCDNLDGTSLVIFTQPHELSVGDKLIIKFFDLEVNGVYTVLTVPSLEKITVAFSFTGDRTVVNGTGLGFTLTTQRVAQASDILLLPYANTIEPGARVWVDNNGNGSWAVLEKQEVFSELLSVSPAVKDINQQYGTAVAQAQNRFAALVGSPLYRLPETFSQWSINDTYTPGEIVVVPDPVQAEFFQCKNAVAVAGVVNIYNTSYWTPYNISVQPQRGAVYVYVKNNSETYSPISPLAPEDAVLSLDVFHVSGTSTNASISGTVLTLGGTVIGSFEPGMILTGNNVVSDTTILAQLTGTAGLAGTYSISVDYTALSPVSATAVAANVPAVRNLGAALTFGNQDWAAAGAPGSLGSTGTADNGYAVIIYRAPELGAAGTIPFANWQLLTSPNSVIAAEKFGSAVAMSQDERWLYVAASGNNAVHAYAQVPWEDQKIRAFSDGVTKSYFIGNTIQIDQDTQLTVLVEGNKQTLGVDYTVTELLTQVIFVTAPAQGEFIEIVRTSRILLDQQVSYDVVQSATSGAGTGAKFTVVYQRNQVGPTVSQPSNTVGSVSVSAGGVNYVVGNTITLSAASFGGQSVNGAITLTVLGVDATTGAVSTFSVAYTPTVLATQFSLNEYLYTVDSVYSFSVLVDGVLQRPGIDYGYSGLNDDITFLNVPVAGAAILIRAESYYEYCNTITNVNSVSGDQFGYSVSTSTDGRQILIGANQTTVNTVDQAGTVYVYDRCVQKFIYGTDGSTVTFTVLGTVNSPVAVLVNGEFFTNEISAAPNATNTFTVSGNIITINGNLQVGDIIEIETNEFQLVQTINQNIVESFANYGQTLDLCSYNCSMYVGAPNSSYQIIKGGVVERLVNQSRVYGVTACGNPGGTLTAGNTLRVNNQDVVVPGTWNNSLIYTVNTVVYNTADAVTSIYSSLQSVPAGTALTNTSYWRLIQTTTVLSSVDYRALAAQINIDVPNAIASVDEHLHLTIAVKNIAAAMPGNLLQVAPGSIGTAFDDIDFTTFVLTQTIQSPYPVDYAGFGSSVSIDDTAVNLVVGAPRGTLYLITVFDLNNTDFDEGATDFFDQVLQSGAVYTYDLLPSSDASVTNPDKFVFGQQIDNPDVASYDQYGTAVDYSSGVLFTGAPGNESEDSTLSGNFGRVFVSVNENRVPAWTTLQNQQPVVDVRLLNNVYLYDVVSSETTQYLDFFDPLQGKILSAARQNIDYLGAIDPASYNVGASGINGTTWGENQVGEVWWDTSTVRFIDPNQDDIVYASRRWGQVFPGSSVDVYQWIVSPTPPSDYAGEGTPLTTLSYVVNSVLSNEGVINLQYFFWVQGITVVATAKGKTLPVSAVANYIENPRATGIAYMAAINASTVAIYNVGDLLDANDTVLSIEFDRELTNANVHTEYELIAQGKDSAWLSQNLYRKLQDSFCGVDTAGNLVPDVNLNAGERYGVQFRPRQSMFVNRFAALKNYLSRANTVLSRYPVSENRSFDLLNSRDPEPTAGSGQWNKRVANLEILGFQNIYAVALGYNYLVVSDSNNGGLWTIYTVTETVTVDGTVRQLVLSRVQNYNTRQYWNYINWYLPGYNTSSKIIVEVPNIAALNELTVPVGSSVKVTANSQGKFEIYLRTQTGFQRVGLQDGTIEFSAVLWNYALGRYGFDLEVFDAQYFDQEPVIETRKIIQAINQELFVDDLLIERNRALTLMFDFVLSEQGAPEWLVKTSLIDVEHRIRALLPFQNYSRDNQEFVVDYIQEVKPYHVQIREFNLRYSGRDVWPGDVADFDLPAYYNTSLEVPRYTSPILLPYEAGTAFNSEINTLSNLPANSTVWDSWPYSQWFNNYLLSVISVTVINGGTGYAEIPTVTFVPNANDPAPIQAAQATAVLNGAGQVVAINVTQSGSGYRSIPTVTITGGNGSGATAYAQLVNNVVRQFRTVIRYDRYQYQSAVVDWNSNGTYENGTLVRYRNQVWSAQNADGSSAVIGPTFDLENWELVDPATYTYPGSTEATGLTGVDRTMGLYVPGINEPGLELPLLVNGVDYPGVQVWGDYFTNTATLDANYQSEFADIYLGTRFDDINVNGGEFVGPYEGHAPEELVNGAEYDSLDLRVYTRPGSDWSGDGHGFAIASTRYSYDDNVTTVFSWANLVQTPFQLIVSNITTGLVLTENVDFVTNWTNSTVDVFGGADNGDIINIDVYEIGGGSQLFRSVYPASEVIANNNKIQIPVNWAEISECNIFVNGEIIAAQPLAPYTNSVTWSINSTFANNSTVFNNNEIQCTATTAVFNVINCSNTSALTVGQPIVFSGTVFGGLVAGQEYYVLSVPNSIQFLVTATAGSTVPVTLTTAAGTMTASPKGTYYRAIQAVPAGIQLSNTQYWLPFVPSLYTEITISAAISAGDTLSMLVLGNTSVIPVTTTTVTSNAIALSASTNSLVVGQTVIFNGYSLGGIATDVVYQILAIVGPAEITITQNGATPVALITDTADWTKQLVAKFIPPTLASWSTPVIEHFVVDAGIQTLGSVTVSDVPQGTNAANMVVLRNGVRLTGPACIEWTGDDTTTEFGLPQRLGVSFSQATIDPVTDIQVYVNNVLQLQSFGAIVGTYSVTNYDGSNTPGRQIVFVNPPADGDVILIAVSTLADCLYDYDPSTPTFGNQLQILPALNINDLISVITWNDTSQQQALTQAFYGPVITGTTITEGYDDTNYDSGSVSGAPGSFDFALGVLVAQNNFDLGRLNVNAGRLWVSLDGLRLFEGEDFTVSGTQLVLSSGAIQTNQVLTVTQLTNSVVPEAVAFRIFQDMRGVQATYRMTTATTTVLTQDVTATADVIYVASVDGLTEPDLINGAFGVITVGAERIMYRVRDTVTNTVSGLQRGTAGTATNSHASGTAVYNLGPGNLLNQNYQDYVVRDTGMGDGTTVVFYAPNINISDFGDSSTAYVESIEVYVGGIRQYNYSQPEAQSQYRYIVTDFGPLAVEFITDNDPVAPLLPPAAGSEVTILQRRGVTWYAPGVGTPSNGVALQETDTIAARFLCDR